MGNLAAKLDATLAFLAAQLRAFASIPLDPNQRVFLPYLLSSLLFAVGVYVVGARTGPRREAEGRPRLFRFLFPKEVWSQPSAWLDVRYFFFHQIVRLSIYGGLMPWVSATTYAFGVALFAGSSEAGALAPPAATWLFDALFVVGGVLATDFISYGIHRLQHRIPILWEFHKVHHSATVMHPLTNYREHPFDNLQYAIGTGFVVGALGALAHRTLGYVPSGPRLLGVGAAMFAFNALGYNLRHSHVWLRWPGRLSMLFGSPAHHQIHHSASPDHLQKNFAFMFPVWDVLFGTFHLPERGEGLMIGLGNAEEADYRTCLGLYFLPLRKAFRIAFGRSARAPARSIPPE